MKPFKRIFTIVIDSVGVGSLPDADSYNDAGSNTLKHISESVDQLKINHLVDLGISNICTLKNIDVNLQAKAYYTKMFEASVGKDTMTGHWEMMGLKIDEPFVTFTEHGFPKELVDELEERTGYKYIGNKSASGTEILDELAPRHLETKELILYTSADSVLQIAACEDLIGLDELYRVCEIARDITMKPQWRVGRVIARPFIVVDGKYERTSNRHDYALKPFAKTALDSLKEANYDVISVGKINDIFDGEGVSESHKSKSSVHGMQQTIEIAKKDFTGLCFVNLVDFDAKWGHRRNALGYAKELEDFDVLLGDLINELREDDLLMITADHGNDPTWHGTDHTREMVPLLCFSKSFKGSGLLNMPDTFACVGATIADNFKVSKPGHGTSILEKLI
ncbi:MAG: phosphopentomutase [Erysipelotrichaceae bacterium]